MKQRGQQYEPQSNSMIETSFIRASEREVKVTFDKELRSNSAAEEEMSCRDSWTDWTDLSDECSGSPSYTRHSNLTES